MARQRHAVAVEQQPLLGSASTAAAGGGGPGQYGSGQTPPPRKKTLTEEPPDLNTFQQTSSMYHLPGSHRRSSWVLQEKPIVRTVDVLRRTRRHRIDRTYALCVGSCFGSM